MAESLVAGNINANGNSAKMCDICERTWPTGSAPPFCEAACKETARGRELVRQEFSIINLICE